MSSLYFTFDADLAKEFGVEQAILIGRFQAWIRNNAANGRNFEEGRTWSFNTRKALSDEFPFWSPSQIRRLLNSLIERGVMRQGEFNKKGYDRTLWYAFEDEVRFLGVDFVQLTESSNGSDEIGNSICRNRQLEVTESSTVPTINPTINHTTSPPSREEPKENPTRVDWQARLAEAHRIAEGAVAVGGGGTIHPAAFRRLCEPVKGEPCDWDLDVIPAIASKAASMRAKGEKIQNWEWTMEGALRNRDRRLAGLPAPEAQPVRIEGRRKETAAEKAERLFAKMEGTAA